jgi:hypothetical protein
MSPLRSPIFHSPLQLAKFTYYARTPKCQAFLSTFLVFLNVVLLHCSYEQTTRSNPFGNSDNNINECTRIIIICWNPLGACAHAYSSFRLILDWNFYLPTVPRRIFNFKRRLRASSVIIDRLIIRFARYATLSLSRTCLLTQAKEKQKRVPRTQNK